jgi:sulfite exporter TauE/SafE
MVTAGLFGSVHCIGMCGGLVAVAGDGARGQKQRALVQLSYQSARLVSYVSLGIVAGSLGRALDLAGEAAGLGQGAAIAAGTLMSAWGAWALLEATGARVKLPLPRLRILPARLVIWLRQARTRPPLVRAALLGGASALLPCGFLYAFALAAAATASPGGGALVMAALWLGNMPALVGFGFVFSGVLSRLKRHVPVLSATSVLLLGLFTLNSRTNLPAFALAQVSRSRSAQAAPPSAQDCPCHRKHAHD